MVLVLGVAVLGLGSHDEELAEEAADVAEAREIEGSGAALVAVELVDGAEGRLVAMEGARVKGAGAEGRRGPGARDGGGVSDGRGGRGAWGSVAVAEVRVGVGAEEGEDEDGGEDFDGVAGAAEARHLAGVGGECRGGRSGHGSVRLGTASHGCAGSVAGEKQIPPPSTRSGCGMTARKARATAEADSQRE